MQKFAAVILKRAPIYFEGVLQLLLGDYFGLVQRDIASIGFDFFSFFKI